MWVRAGLVSAKRLVKIGSVGLVLAGLTVWVWAGAYLSARDCSQLFIKSIDTPDIRDEHGIPFQVFYGISVRATTSLSALSFVPLLRKAGSLHC